MHRTAAPIRRHSNDRPTIWGLDPIQLHDYFWAARGVQVVRQGERVEIAANAELFLLTDPRTLVIFRLRRLVELLSWTKPAVMFIRLQNTREQGYRETVLTDGNDGLIRFLRSYGGSDSRLARVALTRDRDVAKRWQRAPDARSAWQRMRREVARPRREVATIKGKAFDCSLEDEQAQFVRELIRFWNQPAATIPHVTKLGLQVWAGQDAQVNSATRFVGPVWIGSGRRFSEAASIVGPAALWDDPTARPMTQSVRWGDIEPTDSLATGLSGPDESAPPLGKRVFDTMFAAIALLLTLPLYPFVMLAIYLEDGRPFFFGHVREGLRGRPFTCWKFRSMRKDADRIKAELLKTNQADGPQFFIDDDPRLTRVGRIIRKLNIDELPQFVNVLLGQMAVVGPRPSPYCENQYCPAWREARLSVRPGITGLWQVMRTRQQGMDFQEWIKYDLLYVSKAGWKSDLVIICKTILVIVRGIFRS